MEEIEEIIEEAGESKLNSTIAILVALTATVTAIANIKDDNIVQAMTKAQANSVNTWAYFQSKSTKQQIAEGRRLAIEMQIAVAENLAPDVRKQLEQKRDEAASSVARYETEKAEIQKKAEDYTTEYDRLNLHDDQFDIAEASLTVSIALYGVTALTQKRWLMWFASVFAAVGLVMVIAGFLQWSLRPEWLAKFLG